MRGGECWTGRNTGDKNWTQNFCKGKSCKGEITKTKMSENK